MRPQLKFYPKFIRKSCNNSNYYAWPIRFISRLNLTYSQTSQSSEHTHLEILLEIEYSLFPLNIVCNNHLEVAKHNGTGEYSPTISDIMKPQFIFNIKHALYSYIYAKKTPLHKRTTCAITVPQRVCFLRFAKNDVK